LRGQNNVWPCRREIRQRQKPNKKYNRINNYISWYVIVCRTNVFSFAFDSDLSIIDYGYSDYYQIYSDFYKCPEKNTFKIPVFKSAFFARCILIYDIYELWQVIKQNWSIITKVTDLFSTLWGTIPSKKERRIWNTTSS
jgi:hypothetical protein